MKQKLYSLISEIFQLESYIQGWRDKDSIPSIEKDLVLRKLQEIYDEVRTLHSTSRTHTEHKADHITEEVIQKVNEPEITIPGPVEEIKFEKKTEVIEEVHSIIEDIPLKSEPVVEEIQEPVIEDIAESFKEEVKPQPEEVQEIVEVTVTKTEIKTEKKESGSKEILANKLSHPQKLINETVSTRTVIDVSSKIKASPIPSIQSAINLNDKFVFIRELFKNNNLLYNQTIERLNNAANYNEAISIIEKEFAWDMNDSIVAKLVELVKRKHNA
jgi:hypothetical protein